MSGINQKRKIIDYETLMPFQSNIPFNLTHRPKPIIQTSPLTKIETPEFELVSKASREKYRKTKPRVCMPYQICVDDLDSEAYEFYVSQIYCSKKDNNGKYKKPVVYTDINELPDPVRHKNKVIFEDNRTYRERDQAHEKHKRKLRLLKSCKSNETPKISDEVKDLVNTDKVRWIYDKLKPGYAGYRPKCAGYTPLEKKEFYKIDRCVTTLQVMQNNYKKF